MIALVQGMNIGDCNVIGGKNNLYGPDQTPSNTLIMNGARIDKGSLTDNTHTAHLEYLHSVLVKCHETFRND